MSFTYFPGYFAYLRMAILCHFPDLNSHLRQNFISGSHLHQDFYPQNNNFLLYQPIKTGLIEYYFAYSHLHQNFNLPFLFYSCHFPFYVRTSSIRIRSSFPFSSAKTFPFSSDFIPYNIRF